MILERLGKELLYFDGGMGTLLQERGLKPGELPETWNLEHADEVIDAFLKEDKSMLLECIIDPMDLVK